ncbi:hypothetical protein ATANTOWER_031856 [Ataeniobius toweri]|uniref:Uncharacterized protein n=1 Tax=Ataeniobius toweri TaxID=208326 RepID=A0ABU7B5P8_9TELE|nr:hypothetical protein [Ataeniobius toweri]
MARHRISGTTGRVTVHVERGPVILLSLPTQFPTSSRFPEPWHPERKRQHCWIITRPKQKDFSYRIRSENLKGKKTCKDLTQDLADAYPICCMPTGLQEKSRMTLRRGGDVRDCGTLEGGQAGE